jgi:Asp-tRNA(Asn)/Glu-tRNA(Gln) amidotransferase C subunit
LEEKMPRKTEKAIEVKDINVLSEIDVNEDEVSRLNRMLGAVMKYISDDEIVEIDIEYLLENTEGLRKWWNEYREKDRKKVEEEIKKSLSSLSLEELEKIREQINEKEG